MSGEARFLRSFPAKQIVAERANNTELWDAEGRRWLDLGGASHGVALVGHNHPEVVAAVQAQAGRLLHVAQSVQSAVRAEFLDRLHAQLPLALERTFIANSGTEGVECALKLAAAATGRTRIVAMQRAFHGRTLGALAGTHRPEFRAPVAGLLPPTDFVPFNDIEALKAAATQDTAAILLEPVQGEGGVRAASREFLRAARDIATDTGAILVHDEVQSGLGRTGRFLAAEVVPDTVVLAKGLAGGVPIGTCSATAELAAKLPPGGHGSTYGGNPLACAAGNAVLKVLERERLAERAARLGESALARLRRLDLPNVRGIEGAGLMLGVDLRVRPQPVLQALSGVGILALAGGTTGVRLLPPLTIPDAHLDEGLAALETALA
ncbi:MAG TPA: aspartate aminotransferase family protein [Candidatus Thermoplasmatota archaeon]|nr:aspartate aminotransferase family protein [Candidatus Thermoplasmatota archaeon]